MSAYTDRYLVSYDDTTVVGEVCQIGLEATTRISPSKDNVLIRSFLLRHATLHDLDFGEFNIAEGRMNENLEIVSKVLDANDELLMNVYNNVAQVAASKCLYDESLKWWSKAEAIFDQPHDPWPEKGVMININLSRNYYCTGQYAEGRRRLEAALRYAREEGSPYFDAQ
jgi:tetratricopeptide (TPR) repeat protein